MYYKRLYNFSCNISALVYKKTSSDIYHIWFDDMLAENMFETFCQRRDSLYHVLNSGVQYLLSEREPALMCGRYTR